MFKIITVVVTVIGDELQISGQNKNGCALFFQWTDGTSSAQRILTQGIEQVSIPSGKTLESAKYFAPTGTTNRRLSQWESQGDYAEIVEQ